MERAWNRPTRRVGIALALLALAGTSGCARFDPLRRGSSTASTHSHAPADRDEYAEWLEARSPQARAAGRPLRPDDAALAAGAGLTGSRSTVPPPAVAALDATPEPPPQPDPQPEVASDASPDNRQADDPVAAIRPLVERARAQLDAVATYQVTLHRQERLAQGLQEPEDVLLSIRRQPVAVRIEWPDGPHQGREAIYDEQADPGFTHVYMADAILPVKLRLALDNPQVLANSRHPITEAGLDTVIEGLERALAEAATDGPKADVLRFEGAVTDEALGDGRPRPRIVRVKPDGETWTCDLDPETGLPALVRATDGSGQLLELYVFKDFQPDPPALASADAFDPKARWSRPAGGLFGLKAAAATGADTAAR